MAAPASAASIDAVAISFAVTGRYSDMLGVRIAPVGAHVIMALCRSDISILLKQKWLQSARYIYRPPATSMVVP